MTGFPRNRYDASEFQRGLETSQVVRDGNELCVSFATSHKLTDEMTIWFPFCGDEPSAELLQLARHMCADINQLDNMVQDSCESECQRNGLGPENYDLYLAFAEIENDIVGLEYFGAKVNTKRNAKFKRSPVGEWAKVNY